jgi:uncharacterized membrane protein YedE/YeeE
VLAYLFPSGWSQFLTGGLIIGLGVGLMFLTLGRVVGMSTFFSSSLSWFSTLNFFKQDNLIESRSWRLWCAIGLIVGAAIWAIFFAGGFQGNTSVGPVRLLLGGLLVGFGSRLSNGCTSGHGICGLSSLSVPSLLAVLAFMATAIVTANLLSLFLGAAS